MNENHKFVGIHSKPVENSSDAKTNSPKARWCAVPWDVGGRIILLFTALCLIKLAILVGFQKHLFEIHWRTGTITYTWVNKVVFYVFAILVGLNLWRLGTRCMAGNARMVRAANICVLALGVLFIFLTFRAGDKNYLYPVMHGTLKWWDLRWYLDLAFFFQPPFLAIWLFVYTLIYYGLARTGRERLVLHVTAVFAAIYTALFLQDLIVFRDALLVADCLGVACFLAGSGSRCQLNWFGVVQPWIWFVFLFFLFRSQNEILKNLNPECALLWGWSVVIFAGLSVFAYQRKFYPAWLWLLPFAFASFLLLTTINYDFAANYQNLLCVGLTLPHYFLGEFLLSVVLLTGATLYRRLFPSASLWWLDGVNLLLIALALTDLRLSQIMGVRLDWQAVEFGADFKMVWRMAKPFLPGMAVGLTLLIGLYAVLVGLWQRVDSAKTLRLGPSGRFLIISFLLLGIAGDWFVKHDKAEGESALLLAETSPLFARVANPIMDDKVFITTAQQLGLEQMIQRPATIPVRASRDLNVVLIFQESSYNKYLSLFGGKEDTQPLLSKYKERMELFPNFFCNFPSSVNARFATLAGLYPVRNYEAFTLHRVDVKSLFEILHQNGYSCSVFDSCFLDYSGFRDFLQERGIDSMYDADTMPGRRSEPSVSWGLREEETLGAIQSQIKQYATNHQKFFLSYFPVAPHNPFDGTPRGFEKFPLGKMGDYTPGYLNELLYLDWIITSIVNELKDSGLLDNTLVIITDDHGEMLGENGGPIGHGWAVTPELANIPLIIMDPDKPGYRINTTVGSQVDLLPTIRDLLGIAVPQGQLYQGMSLYSAAAQTDRIIYLNSFQQYGIIKGHRLICGNRETEVRDVTTDPFAKVFTITNNGGSTAFSEMPSTNVSSPSISQFDKFQENFLQNYSHYYQAIQSTPSNRN
jgi:arylsulfatase A-like enzyme